MISNQSAMQADTTRDDIPGLLANAEDALDDIFNSFSTLFSKLEPITMPLCAVAGVGEQSPKPAALPAHVERLKVIGGRIRDMRISLDQFHTRILL